MFHQLLLPFVFSPLSAAAHNVSRFRVVLGAEFLPLYHSAVAKAFQRHHLHPRAAAAAAGAGAAATAAAATAVGVYPA